ncbi:MAG: hypothetical protein H8E73_03525 [Planctomycetes bacterium]|nr:hypothetical protein [Planctomycetota bacterium]
MLRSSKLVAGGFMGADSRSVAEIIGADTCELTRLGYTTEQVTSRMQTITNTAKAGLGNWVRIDDKCQAVVAEARGFTICPWPHSGHCAKRVTTIERLDSGETIHFSDLNIHMIAEHSFFEGKGSPFRIEPETLVGVIF